MNNNYQQKLKSLKKVLKKERSRKLIESQIKNEEKPLSFSELMIDVTPIECDRVVLQVEKKLIKVKPHIEEIDYDYFYTGESYEEAPKTYSKNGQGNKDLQKLEQHNIYPIVSNLDLHGVKLDDVDELLTEFCHYVQQYGVCGRIIHGSGLGSKNSKPILKNKVRHWLREYPEVLAYTEEKGNDGAVLILLRRKNNTKNK